MLHTPLCLSTVEGVTGEPTAEFAQLQLGFVDQTQWRYEVIRPLVPFADRTAAQRAQETDTHPATVRTLRRRFRRRGMPGLLPAVELVAISRMVPTGLFGDALAVHPGFIAAVNQWPKVLREPTGRVDLPILVSSTQRPNLPSASPRAPM